MLHVWNIRPTYTKDGKREIRRRQRESLSCERCRRLKVKCDRKLPCGHCQRTRYGDSCTYPAKGSDVNDQQRALVPAKRQLLPATVSRPAERAVNGATRGIASPRISLESLSFFGFTEPASPLSPFSDNGGCFSGTGSPVPRETEILASFDKVPIWRYRFRGQTHWAACLQEFAAIPSTNDRLANYRPPNKECTTDGITTFERPLLLSGCVKEYIGRIVPDRDAVGRYIENYFCTIELVYRLLHIPSFRREVRSFWEQPDQDPRNIQWDWLAQFLMVIGLGYLTTPGADMKRVRQLFGGAEICLTQMTFFGKPTVLIIKSLCMIVISKHVSAMSCEAYDACGPLMGIVIRHAMSMGLHCEPAHDENGKTHADIEMGRRLWSTIVQIEIQQSVVSGVPPLLRAYDFDITPPSNLNDDDLLPSSSSSSDRHVSSRPELEYTDSSFQIILTKSLNPALEVVSAVNSRGAPITYDKVLELDKQLRGFLAELSILRNELFPNHDNAVNQGRWCKVTQLSMLEMSFKRILLFLHRQPSQDPRASSLYPTSYWTSLECSLGILVHQRELYESSKDWRSMQWFAELFKSDFFLAAMIVGIQLCRKDYSSFENSDAGTVGLGMPPRLTILEALRWCHDIWGKKLKRSHCQSKVHEVLGEVVRSIEEGIS